MSERTTGWKLLIILAQRGRVNELLTALCDCTTNSAAGLFEKNSGGSKQLDTRDRPASPVVTTVSRKKLKIDILCAHSVDESFVHRQQRVRFSAGDEPSSRLSGTGVLQQGKNILILSRMIRHPEDRPYPPGLSPPPQTRRTICDIHRTTHASCECVQVRMLQR